jgi:hypothetical protein
MVTLGSIPDANPNTSEPAAAEIFELTPRPPGSNLLTIGNVIFFEFLDATDAPIVGPTIDWQVWYRDILNGVWPNAEAVTNTAAYDSWATNQIRDADIFVQVLAVNTPGATAKVVIHMAEI